ncbi:MAG: Phormidium phage MIS-PhV1A [Cyanobacteriota bacterium]|jgi:DNA (cytosine-5)-methyltransferase 1
MDKTINAISLFSGIGAFENAAKLVFEENYITHKFIEINSYAQKVLKTHFPEVPIHSDIRDYKPPKPGSLGNNTLLVGGFPCTGTSGAGHRTGLDHPESSLWWEFYRVIVELRPRFIIIENPSGLIKRGLRTILASLSMAGYSYEIEMFTIAMFGAPHRRERIFIIAYDTSNFNDLRQLRQFESWADNVGNDIERTKAIITRSQVESQICSVVNGVSPELSGLHFSGWWRMNPPPDIGIEKGVKGRREAVSLVGRSICLPQAICTLLRLKFLLNLEV